MAFNQILGGFNNQAKATGSALTNVANNTGIDGKPLPPGVTKYDPVRAAEDAKKRAMWQRQQAQQTNTVAGAATVGSPNSSMTGLVGKRAGFGENPQFGGRMTPTIGPTDYTGYAKQAAGLADRFAKGADAAQNAGPYLKTGVEGDMLNQLLGGAGQYAGAAEAAARDMYGNVASGQEKGVGALGYDQMIGALDAQKAMSLQQLGDQQALAAQQIGQQNQAAQDAVMRNALSMAGSSRGGNFGAANAAAMNAQAMGTQAANANAQNQLANLNLAGLGQRTQLELADRASRDNAAKESAILNAGDINSARAAILNATQGTTANMATLGGLAGNVEGERASSALQDKAMRNQEYWKNVDAMNQQIGASAQFQGNTTKEALEYLRILEGISQGQQQIDHADDVNSHNMFKEQLGMGAGLAGGLIGGMTGMRF